MRIEERDGDSKVYKKPTIKYKTMKASELVPYASNSRTHSDDQIAQIARSISEFGFLNPVIIDADNGIVAGHGRILACEQAGITEVPCVQASHLTADQIRAYVIADNQLALNADWDMDMLKVEIDGLTDLDFDIELLGFDDGFFDDLDYSGANRDIDVDGFDDEMELKFKLSSDQYESVREKLRNYGDNLECSLMAALSL